MFQEEVRFFQGSSCGMAATASHEGLEMGTAVVAVTSQNSLLLSAHASSAPSRERSAPAQQG